MLRPSYVMRPPASNATTQHAAWKHDAVFVFLILRAISASMGLNVSLIVSAIPFFAGQTALGLQSLPSFRKKTNEVRLETEPFVITH